MKKTSLTLFAITAIAVGFGVSNIAMSDITQKIAVVDVPAVVASSQQVQNLKKENEQKIKDLQKWIDVAKADVEKQQTQEGKEKLIKKYDSDFATKREALQKAYNQKLQAIDKSISSTIEKFATTKGYGLVLSKGVVLYGGDDITAEIQKTVK